MTDDYDLALRRDRAAGDPDVLDDIVVRNVNMFRAEAMDLVQPAWIPPFRPPVRRPSGQPEASRGRR